MSTKTSVGDVYSRIINDVIESSRTAFEEDGIDMSALDLLQSEWKSKLSNMKIAVLSWDPVPTKQEPAQSSNVKQQGGRNGNISPPPSQSPLNTLPPMKSEATTYTPLPPVQQSYPPPNFPQGQPLTARDRAAMHLHQNYGDRAGAQIAELQGGQRVPQQPQQAPYIKQEPQQTPMIKTDQTDGAGDEDRDAWAAEYARRKAEFKNGKDTSERLIRDHVRASQQDLEGGGLMMPLAQRQSFPAGAILGKSSLKAQSASVTRAQGDAAGDDDGDEEEVDENAINSDLDDPEDAADNIEGTDPEGGNIMLCTYDKVQRVKNKWKCTLKDGILGVDGTDHLFHKGQGEFEW